MIKCSHWAPGLLIFSSVLIFEECSGIKTSSAKGQIHVLISGLDSPDIWAEERQFFCSSERKSELWRHRGGAWPESPPPRWKSERAWQLDLSQREAEMKAEEKKGSPPKTQSQAERNLGDS